MTGSIPTDARTNRRRAPRRRLARWSALCWAIALLLLSVSAVADDRTAFLISRLQFPPVAPQTDDFRVRTNAALQLGATNDEVAIQPLCNALNDPSDVVRLAVAVALKRLGRASSLTCLQTRESFEPKADVKLNITRAIESIRASTNTSAVGPPPNVPDAKYYVSVSVSNKTSRPQAEIEAVVMAAIQNKVVATKIQLAPKGESPAAARAEISKRKLSGYYLAVSVEDFNYSGGNLRAQVKVAVFSYPGKDLRGGVEPSATAQGVRQPDHGTEDQLVTALAEHAVDQIAQSFH